MKLLILIKKGNGYRYMKYVKFDMHCHTAEGSVDAKVNIEDYIEILRSKGFGGMLVTDHDSYGGYEAYVNSGKKYDDFVVLRGIEYDSLEFGHFIVILPSDTPDEVYELLRYKGLTLDKLIYYIIMCYNFLCLIHILINKCIYTLHKHIHSFLSHLLNVIKLLDIRLIGKLKSNL